MTQYKGIFRRLCYYLISARKVSWNIDQAEKGGMVPLTGKFMKLGGKVNFGVLSSEIDVIRAKKGPSASF